MGFFAVKNGETKEFQTRSQLVQWLCDNDSPFLEGDAQLVEMSKDYACEKKAGRVIQKFEDQGHDMTAYVEEYNEYKAKHEKNLKPLGVELSIK
jgi:hypothetical protein